MKYYLAPMEGITTHVYRTAYHKYFHPMDKYFTPFLVPHTKKGFSTKEIREISPENNQGFYLVPQILSNDAEGFLDTVRKLKEFGYQEVNLNLGCPSKTVVSKNRGSGFLAKTEELDRFLDQIYAGTDVTISIKTRIGKNSPEEFETLLEIYNKYPISELIIHPRVQKDYYGNQPNMEVFETAMQECKAPVCYNGDIFKASDYERICQQFPSLDTVMLGRGVIGNPALLGQIEKDSKIDVKKIQCFLEELLQGYEEYCSGDKNVLFKMKEVWAYMGRFLITDDKLLKKLRKAQKLTEYKTYEQQLLTLLS